MYLSASLLLSLCSQFTSELLAPLNATYHWSFFQRKVSSINHLGLPINLKLQFCRYMHTFRLLWINTFSLKLIDFTHTPLTWQIIQIFFTQILLHMCKLLRLDFFSQMWDKFKWGFKSEMIWCQLIEHLKTAVIVVDVTMTNSSFSNVRRTELISLKSRWNKWPCHCYRREQRFKTPTRWLQNLGCVHVHGRGRIQPVLTSTPM